MIHAGLAAVLAKVAAAAAAAGRDLHSINLIAVSKTFGPDAIVPVIEAGQRQFGENRVQEAKAKWPALRMRWPDVRLHLIGPLQTNKVTDAVSLFDAIHTLDRPKLALAIGAEMRRQGLARQLFIQVNTGLEPQKSGIAPADTRAFCEFCRNEAGLAVDGLMCIPPADAAPQPHFALLAELARACGLSGLSMGMSGDYAEAVMAGATHVRVGSAIFGSR